MREDTAIPHLREFWHSKKKPISHHFFRKIIIIRTLLCPQCFLADDTFPPRARDWLIEGNAPAPRTAHPSLLRLEKVSAAAAAGLAHRPLIFGLFTTPRRVLLTCRAPCSLLFSSVGCRRVPIRTGKSAATFRRAMAVSASTGSTLVAAVTPAASTTTGYSWTSTTLVTLAKSACGNTT